MESWKQRVAKTNCIEALTGEKGDKGDKGERSKSVLESYRDVPLLRAPQLQWITADAWSETLNP